MCYYDQQVFACGDWKWDKFRSQCVREHRRGETCGMRMIGRSLRVAGKCKTCDKIDCKLRRRADQVEKYNRWMREGATKRASMEKALETIAELDHSIHRLNSQRACNNMAGLLGRR